MSWLYVIVGIICLYALQFLRGALNVVFPAARTELLVRAPDSARVGGPDLFDTAATELSALGLEGPFWFENLSEHLDRASVSMQAAYVDRSRKVVVWLAPPIDVNAPNRLLTYYTTSLADGRYAVTQVSDPFFTSTRDPMTPAQTIAPTDFETELQEHVSFVATLDSAPSDAILTRRGMQRFAGEHMNTIRDRLIARGDLIDSDGAGRPGFRYALRLLWMYLRRPQGAAQEELDVPVDRLSYLASVVQAARERSPARTTQWQLFALSAVLFVAIGWPIFGVDITIVILGVIVLHEAGHWIGMQLAGYRSAHVTLLPLLGGVTIGHETAPSAAIRAWVSLAGPLPGIILGWVLVYWLFQKGTLGIDTSNWLVMTAFMLLIINYLNVLPIPPLDGSHIVRALVPPRWAALQILTVLLGVAVGVIVARMLQFWPLALIATLQLFAIPSIWRDAKLVREIATGDSGGMQAERDGLGAIFRRIETQRGAPRSARRRIVRALAIDSTLRMKPMGAVHGAAVGVVFMALLVVPVAVLAVVSSDLITSRAILARGDDIERQYEELRVEADGQTVDQLLRDLGVETTEPAERAALDDAAARLGRTLPAWLEEFYGRTNGLPGFGIGPVEDIVPVGEAAIASEALELFAYEGELFFFDGEVSVVVALGVARDWWVIGQSADGESIVYTDPQAPPGEPAVFEIVATEARAHTDIDALLRQLWLDERWSTVYEDYFGDRRDAALERLRAMSIDELVDEFPRPGLIERITAGKRILPEGATESDIDLLQRRIGRSLPADHRAFLERHNGYPRLALLATDAIVAATALETWQLEHLLNSMNRPGDEVPVSMPPLTPAQLEECWVVAGVAVPPQTDDGATQLFPQLLWCPTRPPESLYLGMTTPESYPDFASALAFRIAQMQAAYGG